MTIYRVGYSGQAVTAQQDLWSILAPTTGIVLIHHVVISQASDYKDVEDEGLVIQLDRGATTTGSGGTAVTVGSGNAVEPAGPAFGGTVRRNDTTKASAGTISILHAETWSVRSPFEFLPPPELRPIVAPGQRFVVELASTPADSLTVAGSISFEYLGA